MKIKCLIFDFDGTLFDSMPIWEHVAEDYLNSLNIYAEKDLYENIKDLSLYQSAKYLKEKYNLSFSIEQIIKDINKIIEDSYINKILPKPGVLELLKKIKSLNIHMCITTATDRYLIEAALKRCHIDYYFKTILTCNEVGHGKDEPVIYRKAIEYFHIKKHNTIIFEDALYALRTAKKDGFMVIGIYDKSEKNQEEIKIIADRYIKEFNCEEIYKIIEEVNKL